MKEKNPARICVPICARQTRELSAALARAAEIADVIELRLDCLDELQLQLALPDLDTLRSAGPRPSILTLRPAEQGGQRPLDLDSRRAFWSSLEMKPGNALFDWELDLTLLVTKTEPSLGTRWNWDNIICSHHDFACVPDDLEKLYERMSSTPARILKLAVRANEVTDCLPLFRLLDRAQDEGREMIAIAMGEAGLATRILGPSRGAYLTYGSLDEDNRTAPGQLSAFELRDLYRLDRLDRQAMITGLVGSPVAHSVSPQMHNAAFKSSDLNAVYIPFEVRQVGLFVRRMAHPQTRELDWNLRGFSVTAPHKTAIMEHLDSVEPSAGEIGAVNTVVVEDDGLRGFNTDVTAFVKTLSEKAGTLRGLRCAVIGAGGAARGVLWGLRQEGARATLFARDAERAKPLAEKFEADLKPLARASFEGFDAVINTTPLGTRGTLEGETPAVASQLRGARLAYDLVYNPDETRFLREARQAGCETTGGLPMLVSQAVEQFKLWTGEEASFELMLEAAQTALGASR